MLRKDSLASNYFLRLSDIFIIKIQWNQKWATFAALKCFHNGIILIVISKKYTANILNILLLYKKFMIFLYFC